MINVAVIARPIRWFRRAQVGSAILGLVLLISSVGFFLQALDFRTQGMSDSDVGFSFAAGALSALLVLACAYLWRFIPRGSYLASGIGMLLSLVFLFLVFLVLMSGVEMNAYIYLFYLALGALALGIAAISTIPSRRLLHRLNLIGHQDCYRLARPRLPKHWRRAVRATAHDGMLLASVVILLALSVCFLLTFTVGMFGGEGIGPQIIVLLIAGAIWVASTRITRVRERRRVMSATELRRQDPRPPVLLLRSFCDDASKVDTDGFRTLFLGKSIFEEEITRTLAQYGPVIAIGQPGETIPSLGAAREYLTHTDWQAQVGSLVGTSSLIVLMAGNTPGIAWELEHILDRDEGRKLIFMMPPLKPAELRKRWLALCRPICAIFGEEISQWPHPERILLVMRSGVDTLMMESKQRDRINYNVALLLASRSLGNTPLECH